MEWTEEHNVYLLWEIITSNVFSFKKRSVARGERWEAIAETLNKADYPKFLVKYKRGVRDRWVLLQKKFKSKICLEEAASEIAVEEPTEKEVLLEELVEKDNCIVVNEASSQKEDKYKADDMRMKALERLSQTKRRNASPKDCLDDKPKRTRRSTEPLVEFLQEKAKSDRELRQQELEFRREEQAKSQNMMSVL